MKNNFENIPEELKEGGRFTLHSEGIPKRKYNNKLINNNFTEEKNLLTFNEAIEQFNETEATGISLVLKDSLCGIDLDNVIQDGKTNPEAIEIVKKIASYTEQSPSGKGLHIFFKMKPEEQIEVDLSKYYKNNQNYITKDGEIGIEIYQGTQDTKPLTMTGNQVLLNTKKLNEVSRETLQDLFETYNKKKSFQEKALEGISIDLKKNEAMTDEDFVKIGLQKDNKLIELWNATPTGKNGIESQTDLSFLDSLAFWSNKNEQVMIQYFEASPYFNKKDEEHVNKWKKRTDYKKRTIEKAIATTMTTAREKSREFLLKQEQKQKEEIEQSKGMDLEAISSFNGLKTFFKRMERGTFIPISTGFQKMDSIFNGGILNQSLVTLGGGTSTGKTTFSINLALNIAKQRPVIYYTLEMSEDFIQSKIFSNIAYNTEGMTLSSSDFLKSYDENIMTEERKQILEKAIDKHTELQQLFIRYPKEAKIEYIIKEANQINATLEARGQEKAILFVDYLQFIQGDGREDSQSTIKRIQKELKQYTIDNDSIVVLLIANNRQSEGGKTTISSGRDSSDIEYSSDYQLQLNFTEWERGEDNSITRDELVLKNPRRMTITIHKNRMGMTGDKIDFIFNPTFNNFKEVSETERRQIHSNTRL